MKKILFTAVSALAISAAIAADSTQFGVLQVPSSATNTIVSVPWLESGTGSDNVKVADLVLTAGLSDGDELRLYENPSWTKAWILTDGKWVGAQVSVKGGTKDSGDDSTRIERGKAIMLIRKNPTGFFYIMGKPSSAGVQVSLGSGYSLVAPPSVAEVDVNTGMTWVNIATGDQLYIPTTNNKLITLTYKSDVPGWGKVSASTHKWEKTGTISAGMGAWFKSNGEGSDKSFTFGTAQ